jgi:hypothetical protein
MTTSKGPIGYHNWKAALDGASSQGALETHLYSDAYITGYIAPSAANPYSFLKALPMTRRDGTLAHCATLRVELHLEADAYAIPAMDVTDTSQYVGGDIFDELGALASLLLGARIRPGGIVRRFDVGTEPRGSPQANSYTPALAPPRGVRGPKIARACTPKNLNEGILPS